jgi:hypothetical protein
LNGTLSGLIRVKRKIICAHVARCFASLPSLWAFVSVVKMRKNAMQRRNILVIRVAALFVAAVA